VPVKNNSALCPFWVMNCRAVLWLAGQLYPR
jgi:hypothetical protein